MTRLSSPFVNPTKQQEQGFYDLIGDWELIEASFAQQYGIRLRREDDMSWDEFTTLLGGINGDTPLGHIVSIRAETDPEVIKRFSASEKKIRNEWRSRHRKVITDKQECEAAMNGFLEMFKSISKGG